MYRVTCSLVDGSVLTEMTTNPKEVVVRYFTAYGAEILHVVVAAEEKKYDFAQLRALS